MTRENQPPDPQDLEPSSDADPGPPVVELIGESDPGPPTMDAVAGSRNEAVDQEEDRDE